MTAKPFALLLLAGCVIAAAPPQLSPTERVAVFKAAGAVQRGGKWLLCPDEPNPEDSSIEQLHDLNGDGRPEAVITEGGSFCYGHAYRGYAIVSKQANGSWRPIAQGSGIPNFLATKSGGWPDMEIGGPGFCFPVQRWNGKGYAFHRNQYEGKPCRPNR